MICPYCKENIQDGAVKCRYCGSALNLASTDTIGVDTVTIDEMRTFIGSNSYYYIQNFSKFTIIGRQKFAPTWNWSCFGFTFLWMLYRKMYLLSLITFVIFCMPGLNILMHIVAGVVGNYLYYNQVKDKILEIKATQPAHDLRPVLQEVGGVHKWVIVFGIVIAVLGAISVGIFFSTIIASMGRWV